METIGIITTIVSAASSIIGGFAAQSQADAQAGALRQQAKTEAQIANAEEERIRRANRADLGRQRAAIAQAGTGGFSGSALDVIRDSTVNAELDALAARFRGQSRSHALRTQAAFTEQEGKNALFGGFIGAGTSLLSGASGFGNFGGSSGGFAPRGNPFGRGGFTAGIRGPGGRLVGPV